MPRGGHNRLPDEVKRLRGTAQPCRMNPDAPKVEASPIPAPPERLRADEREVWAELAPMVDGLRCAAVGDLAAYEIVVRAVALERRVLADETATVNQKIQAQRNASAHLMQFGLTPAARAKVKQLGDKPDEDDPLAEFSVQ